MRESIGRYQGVSYRRQRICDMFYGNDCKAFWYFAYIDDSPTGDFFRTLQDFRNAVDAKQSEQSLQMGAWS